MPNRFSIANLSIEKRLPLLICILLLSIVVTFGYSSYVEVKKAATSSSTERLNALTVQISNMFQQMSSTLLTAGQKAARQPAIKKFLQSGGKDSATEAQQIINREQTDSLNPLVELYNVSGVRLLTAGTNTFIKSGLDSVIPNDHAGVTVNEVGIIHTTAGGKMFFPITTTVTDGKDVLGYLVKWRVLTTTQAELDAFSKLIGAKGAFSIGNDDGKFWTNGLKQIPPPPINLNDLQKVISYTSIEGYPVIASAHTVPGSRWLVLISLSQELITDNAHKFLYQLIIMGSVLVVLGIFFAWLISRAIIKPLKKLTNAANAIESGDYNIQVDINRKDELGILAKAFNNMTIKRNRHEEELQFSHEQLRQLAAHLQNVREEERISIAREIHDVLGQLLTGIRISVVNINKKLMNLGHDASKEFKSLIGLIDEAIQSSRKMSSQLRPDVLDNLGLIEALRWQSKEFEDKTGISCMFSTNMENDVLEKPVSFTLYRIYQEALTNIARHSGATEVVARLEYDANNKALLRITDNGKGFNMEEIKSKNRLGIVGMKERALSIKGECIFETHEGSGVAVSVLVPMLEVETV